MADWVEAEGGRKRKYRRKYVTSRVHCKSRSCGCRASGLGHRATCLVAGVCCRRGVSGFFMKLISFNIMGLGKVKKKEIQKIVQDQKPDMLLVQETKVEVVNRRAYAQLWDCDDFLWVCKPSVGSVGGLLIMWKPSSFDLVESFQSTHVFGVLERWGK